MAGPDERLVRFSDGEIRRLVLFYTAAEREILDQLNRALLRGNQTEYLEAMRKNVRSILDDLRNGSRTWCEEAIPRVYVEGLKSADAMIKARGQQAVSGFGAIHQQAAQVLAENAFNRFEGVAQLIGRRTDDIYRTLALENIRGTTVGFETWQQTARNYREQLAERGVTGFQDAKGRNWNMRTYAETVARTTTMEAHLQGTANRLLEHGHDLVKVSTHRGACEKCAPWQGKILSLTGKTEGYPTLEEARAGGLFHPRCRHAYSLHIDLDKETEELERETEKPEKTLPGLESATIPPEKLTHYALNKEHKGGGKHKAIAFERALGYNIDNYQDLIANIVSNLGRFPAVLKGKNQYGDKYEVAMILTGPNGKTAKVISAWLVDKAGKTRLVSVYVKD